jgi:hypothetical protein
MKCLRCPERGNKEPNETGKLIDGVPICSVCMLADATKNRGKVIDYSYLKVPEELEVLNTGGDAPEAKKKKSVIKSKRK